MAKKTARPTLPNDLATIEFDNLAPTQDTIVAWGRKNRESASVDELEAAWTDIAKLTAEYERRMAEAQHEVEVRSRFADPPKPHAARKPAPRYVIHTVCNKHEQLAEDLAEAHAAGEATELPCLYCYADSGKKTLNYPVSEFSKGSTKRPWDPKGPKGWIVEVTEVELKPDGTPFLDDNGKPRTRKRWVDRPRTQAAKKARATKAR